MQRSWPLISYRGHVDVHKGREANGQSYHYQIRYHCSICLYAYVTKFWEENVHICRSYTEIRGTFIQHKNICLVIHVKSLDNSVSCLIKSYILIVLLPNLLPLFHILVCKLCLQILANNGPQLQKLH